MAYGLKIWDSTGTNIRLDTTDRQVKVNSVHQGVFTAGGQSSTVTGITGFDITDETWSIDVMPISLHLELTTTSGGFTISRNSSDPGTQSMYWKVIVFRS
tara:strand:- start:1045 stop:1344 length:300 start_codon:yes stop_codon:yes gene_type:complete